jgi:hypothetical protein
MSASSRMKIIIPLVSAMSLLALSAQAQDAGPKRDGQGPGAGAPPQNNQQNMRKGPPPQQAARPGPQPGGPVHAGPGPGAGPHGPGGPPPGRYARGPVPARDWGGHAYRGNHARAGGRWRH